MATAYELLSGMVLEDVCRIDLVSRTITIPPSIKNLGVESDDDVHELKFSIPRYYGDIDLSTYQIRINYLNANKEGDVYGASDVEITEDEITFNWLVGRFAFLYKGDVEFSVCMRKINSNDEVESEFNTTTATLPVLKGLETDEAALEAYPDIITAVANEVIQQEIIGDIGESLDAILEMQNSLMDGEL